MPKPDSKPSNILVGQMRSWLATHGVPAKDANELVKNTKTMRQIDDDIAAYMRVK